MSFPTVEELRRTEQLTKDAAIEVYEDAIAFNETLLEFAHSEEERRSIVNILSELRTSIGHLMDAPSQTLYAVPHRTLVIAFGHPPKKVEAASVG